MLCRLIFVIVFQYFVFLVKDTIAWLVPDIPSALQAKIARKMHVARMCFRKSAVEATQESTRESTLHKHSSRSSGPAHFDGKGFHIGKRKSSGQHKGRKSVSDMLTSVFHHGQQSYV
jgi:hypothetical protein